jgi:ribonuclease P protein component
LRRSDFLTVYEEGSRYSSPYFAMICLRVEGQAGTKIGFATPKAVGGSVVRNRLRRRLREAVRRNMGRLGPGWAVVVQCRRAALKTPFAVLEREIERLFARCGQS